MTSTTSDRLGALALFVVSLAYFAILAPYGLELADEGHLLHQIYRTTLGQLPYVDFHTGYSPGSYYLNAWLLHGFDNSLLAIRLVLALVNTLCVLLLWWLARRLGASALGACLAGAGYVALIPFYDGQFAPFNIPYPAWYVTLFWLLAAVCMVRWWQKGGAAWWLLAGLFAGLVFTFKQNSGLLALASCLIPVVLLQRPRADATAGAFTKTLTSLERLARWAIPLILTAGFGRLFGGFAFGSQAVPLVAPLAALLALYAGLRSSSPAREVEPGSITLDLVLLSLGFGAVTLPWLVYFWSHLGTTALLRSVFYIGTPYEQYYLIPYPPFGNSGWLMTAAAVVLAALPALVRRLGIRARTVFIACLAAAAGAAILLVLRPPPMVEGFQASVVMQMRQLSFAAVLVLLWAGLLTFFLRARRPRRAPVAGVHLVLVTSAVLMHMQIYPRSDFMHLVYAAPGVLVLAAWLLDRWALELAAALDVAPSRRFLARAAFQAPAYLLAAIFLAPAVGRIEYLARSWWEHDDSALVRLESPRAPLVIEPAAGRVFQSLSRTIHFLDEHTSPTDLVFTFPCLDLLTFLADRQDPSRHGYYYPGSPGHAVEAEVVDALQATPPRYIVTLHDHALFFVGAPVYYFNLRQYVTENFALDQRLGMIDVLRPRSDQAGAAQPSRRHGAIAHVSAQSSAPSQRTDQANGELHDTLRLWQAELDHDRGASAHAVAAALAKAPPTTADQLADLIQSSPPAQQRILAGLIQKSRSATGSAALAIVAATPQLAEREFQLFIRIISAIGDLRSAPPLLAAIDLVTPERRPWLAGNLFNIASKSWIEAYFYAPDRADSAPSQALPQIVDGQLINWLQDPWENPALRSFALRMAGHSTNLDVVPFVVRTAADELELPQLRLDAAHSLVELGYASHALAVLPTLLEGDDMVSGALIASAYDQEPDRVREILAGSLVDSDDAVRTKAFWIAGAVRDPALLPLVEAGLKDPRPEVRMAAAWILGRTGGEGARHALEQASSESQDEVNLFIQRAMRRLPPAPAPAASAPPERPS